MKIKKQSRYHGHLPSCLVEVERSPDPKNPLNDLPTMNKSAEHTAFELPVVAFDLRETRVSVGEPAVNVKPDDVHDCAEATVKIMEDEPRRANLDEPGPARVEQALAWSHQERACIGAYQRLTGAGALEQTGS